MADRRPPWAHPLARHALLDRRAFIRRAVALSAATAAGGSLLAACAGSSSTESVAAPGTSLPWPYDPAVPYWMQGGFAPVADEVETFDLEVTGALPPELTGLYVRNGSNPAGPPSPHWFLGDGMVHGVRLDAGKASWYRNRYVDTPLYRARAGLLGGGPPGGANNQSNVSVFHHAGRLLSSGEIGFPYELSPDDLRTIGPYDFAGALQTAMTAHPKIDPATGKMHFFGYGFAPPYLTYHVASAAGVLEHSSEVTVAGPTMIHDFAITDRDVLFWELPVVFDMDIAIQAVESAGQSGTMQMFPFRWDPSYGARLGVLPLGGPASEARWVEIEPCYVFHGVNAFRDGDEVVADVCRLPTMFDEGGDLGSTTVRRWRIDTSGRSLSFREEIVSDVQMDLPSIDRRRTGLTYDDAWFLLVDDGTPSEVEFAGLARLDQRTGALDRYEPGAGYRLNEGFFVPAEGSTPDDRAGWLLTYAWDRARDASDLVVLDAADLSSGPVARVHLPARVPYGFHGVWIAG